MKKAPILILATATLMACNMPNKKAELKYPDTKKCDSSNVYFGETVKDPYAWLEDDFSEETMAWVKKQNDLTRSYLDKLPAQEKLQNRLKELWSEKNYSLPIIRKKYIYYRYTDGKSNQPKFIRQDNEGNEIVLFDPIKYDPSGLSSANAYSVSKDEKHVAISISYKGSDWNKIIVIDEEGELLSDEVDWVKFSGISWAGEGFYYSRYPEQEKGAEYSNANLYHTVYYHKLGTGQRQDQLIFEDKENPNRTHGLSSIKDGKILLLTASEGTSGNNLSIKRAKDKEFKSLVDNFDNDYYYIGEHNNAETLYFMTNDGAPNKKIMALDVNTLEWSTMLEESKHALKSAAVSKDFLSLVYMKDVVNQLVSYNIEAKTTKEIPLVSTGSISGLSSTEESNVIYFGFENFHTPRHIFEYNLNKGVSKALHQLVFEFKPSDFETIQQFYTSKDGTEIPIFITRKKGLEKSPETPCFLYAYGGFNIPIEPHFKKDRIPFLEDGGIYVVANIRGGSEYGEKWHQQGIKMNKQNVFDDYIAAAEYLKKEGWTKTEKLALHGRSNGGLLIGAVMTQKPNLAQVALPKVGVLDMLKYQNFTIGWAWASDYGRSDDSKEMYDYLKAYSPLHNVRNENYMSTMVITGDHDDRVVPAHSFKFAATLQEKNTSNNPMLLRVESGGGHGAGKPINLQVQEFADQWSFVYEHLGME